MYILKKLIFKTTELCRRWRRRKKLYVIYWETENAKRIASVAAMNEQQHYRTALLITIVANAKFMAFTLLSSSSSSIGIWLFLVWIYDLYRY